MNKATAGGRYKSCKSFLMARELAIYIHWPFCLSKCPYCDFNSRVMPSSEDQNLWLMRYKESLSSYKEKLPERKITSIYFGGGTPSLMMPQTIGGILDHIAMLWPLAESCEITLEANPTSSELDKFKAFRLSGVNRLSLGVQALEEEGLRFLGRQHDVAQAERAVNEALEVFPRASFDLIYAYQGQTLKTWEATLRRALSFGLKHMSLYQLTIEPGSIFYKRGDRDSLKANEALATDMFLATNEQMTEAGLPPYEISNYAGQGEESRHNLTYWHYEDYIGIGPAAHGRFFADQQYATKDESNPVAWLQGEPTYQETLLQKDAMTEALIMGLRLTEGIDKKRWQKRFSQDIETGLDQGAIETLTQEGFLFNREDKFGLTSRGRLFLDEVLVRICSV
ncbi:MAG: radical SAM family heme chaperone HemW [Bdellovibrionales bacterium]